MRIWIRNTAFFLANLRVCELRTGTPGKFCKFAICGLISTNLRICDFRTGTPKKCAYLRLRNEPKNLRIAICGLKKFACPPLLKTNTALVQCICEKNNTYDCEHFYWRIESLTSWLRSMSLLNFFSTCQRFTRSTWGRGTENGKLTKNTTTKFLQVFFKYYLRFPSVT